MEQKIEKRIEEEKIVKRLIQEKEQDRLEQEGTVKRLERRIVELEHKLSSMRLDMMVIQSNQTLYRLENINMILSLQLKK